jgi:hypothetical protein
MRKSTLLLLLAAVACGEDQPENYVVIDDFLARSPRLACETPEPPAYLSVTELRTASDSTVMILDEPGRRLVELDAELRPVWEMPLPAAGPGAVASAVDVAVLGDTAIAIAERQGLQLSVYSRAGHLIRTVPLGFAPSALAARASGELLISAMPFGDSPGTLLFRYDGTGLHELPVQPRRYAEMFVGALGNTTLAEALPGGAIVLMHQFMAPRAFRVGADDRIEALRVPTPDATRASIDYVPDGRIMEEQIERMLVPASAMSIDPIRAEVYLITRSGRRIGGRTERAMLRLDADLGLIESFTLDFAARHLALLPRQQVALIVDDEDRFHACHLPATSDRHARAD